MLLLALMKWQRCAMDDGEVVVVVHGGGEKGSSSFINPALDGSEGGRKKPPPKSLHFPTIACVRAGKIHEKMFLKRKAHCNHALLSP